MKYKRKGGVSTVIATLIGLSVLLTIFFHYFFVNLDMEKYNIIGQYTRDTLLISETQDTINKTYLIGVKSKLSDKLISSNSKGLEYIKMYITLNGIKYDVDTMPSSLKPDFGQEIEVSIEYHYKPRRMDFSQGIVPKREDTTLDVMGTTLKTVSKNRGTSDG